MPTNLSKIEITDQTGVWLAELHIPEKCSDKFKNAIIRFLHNTHNPDGIDECAKIWKLKERGIDVI